MSKIIMISGKQGSGKTTLADRLYDKLVNPDTLTGVVRLKFADPLYAANEALKDAMEPFGIPVSEKEGAFLQFLGTEWGRKKDPDIWVKALKKQVSFYEAQAPGSFIIIDDCRFKNEFDAFPDALRIRLKAPEEDRKVRTHVWRDNTLHASETDLDDYESKFELVIDTGANTKDQTLLAVLKHINLKFSDSLS